jgi:ribonuclease R
LKKTRYGARWTSAGKPIGIYLESRKDARLMIEDYMLLANETIAKYGAKLKTSKKPYPFVYRTHDAPNADKLEQFATAAKRFGYSVEFEDLRRPPPIR